MSWFLAILAATTAPADDGGRTVVVDACRYPTAAEARKAWRPAERHTPPIAVARLGERSVLALPADFKTNDNWRVAWDLAGRWDLGSARRVELDVVCERTRGARMLIYFHSGDGWYARGFDVPPGASRAVMTRKQFRTEGTPGGWDRVDTVRLCVLRGEPIDRVVHVAGIRARIVPSGIVVYRNDAGVKAEPGAPRYAREMADALDRLNLAYDLVGDRAVARGALAGKKIAVLPLNPVLPAGAAAEVRKFVAAGGKLIVCYGLPDPLGKLLGVRSRRAVHGRGGALDAIRFQGRSDRPKITVPQHSWIARRVEPVGDTKVRGTWLDRDGRDTGVAAVTRNDNGYFVGHVLTAADPAATDRLLLEMLGRLWPDVWRQLYDSRLKALGRVAGAEGPEALAEAVRANAADDPARAKVARARLAKAAGLARDASEVMKYGDPVTAAELLGRAQRAYVRAWAASVSPRAGEFRGVWCHSPTGVAGKTWPQALAALADAGFNALLVNACWGDGAAYRSEILPQVGEADQLARCTAAAAARGVAVHVWKVNWRFWRKGRGDFRRKMRRAGRVQVDPDGKPLDWLCPSQPANRALERDAMLEIVRKYPVAGIHFDYIRYPGRQGCYCPRCREAFEKRHKLKVKNWPADVIDGPLKGRYEQFRRDNITALVAEVTREAREVRPKVLISAAVFWHWPTARIEVGQDWKLWVDKGYLDFVCPMQYTDSAAGFDGRTRQTLRWAEGKVPVMPGIGATLGLDAAGAIRQVRIARRQGAAGFVLFNYDARLAREVLPMMKLGASAEPTRWRRRQGPTTRP